MSAAMLLPSLPGDRLAASIGPHVPTVAVTGGELRQNLPPSLVAALDRISDQIGIEILDPLLGAASAEDLLETFERVFPVFKDYYISTVLTMWGGRRGEQQRFSALTIQSFHESEALIRTCGVRWIGQDASLNALNGLATIIRVTKVAAAAIDRELQDDELSIAPWTNSIVAYVMAFSSVLAALTALERGLPTSARLENVATLARWSKSYAARAYHLTKALGLLKASRPVAPIGLSDQEDEVLAEEGLDSYAESLARDDRL